MVPIMSPISVFLCVLVLFIPVAVFVSFYTKTWKMLIYLPLNKVIDFFYHRILADKGRPSHYRNHLEMFPWLNELEANWKAIRDEMLSFVKNGQGMQNVHTTGGEELNKEGKWKLAAIFCYGKPIDEVKSTFPLTLSVLKKLPNIQNAIFSLLKAGGSIPPHIGSTASILRYHLPLIVPDNGKYSWLTVDGVNIPWVEGKGILFDDTFEHSARNGAGEDRIVLIVDIFRPDLGFVDRVIQKIEVWKRTQDFIAGKRK